MAISFSFKEVNSAFSSAGILRPVVEVEFKHQKQNTWQKVILLVDTGADCTLLPKYLAQELGINLSKDCKKISTRGVGGKSIVYLSKERVQIKIGEYERQVPVGFLNSNHIPPLLGRQECLNNFKVTFENLSLPLKRKKVI